MSPAPQRSTAARPLPRAGERALQAAQRARLTVVPRMRSRAPRVPFLVLVTLLLVGGVVGLLLFNTSMQQAAFTATQLEQQARDLEARQEALAMQLDDLRDPQRIADVACAQGMVFAPVATFLDIETGAVSGTPTAAVAAPCGIAQPKPEQPTATAPVRRTPVGGGQGRMGNEIPFAQLPSGVVSADGAGAAR